MKKEIFKVCVLGLVTLTIVTGCGKNEKGVNIITGKEELVSYEEKIQPVVTTIELKQYEKEDYFDMVVEAKSADGEIVWSKKAGKVGKGSDNYSVIAEEGDKYVYMNEWIDEEAYFKAFDKQTGKEVWQVKAKSEVITCPIIIELEDKVYVVSGMAGDYKLEVFDIKTGKSLKYIEDIDSAIPESTDNMQYSLDTLSMKVEGNVISFEVSLDDESGHYVKRAGYLKINIDNYKISFE